MQHGSTKSTLFPCIILSAGELSRSAVGSMLLCNKWSRVQCFPRGRRRVGPRTINWSLHAFHPPFKRSNLAGSPLNQRYRDRYLHQQSIMLTDSITCSGLLWKTSRILSWARPSALFRASLPLCDFCRLCLVISVKKNGGSVSDTNIGHRHSVFLGFISFPFKPEL